MNTLETLKYRHTAGENIKFIHFWGHRPAKDGSITQSCFSQWFEAAFTVDGLLYPTAEHYMMAEKARLFNDAATLAKVLSATSPGAAKAAGREVQAFNQTVWETHRERIVYEANLAKFGQNPTLKTFLLGTGDRVLVEASPVDAIWGVGLAATDANIDNPSLWQGLNLLGFALMAVRESLQTKQ
jgi:ribA/ribD-fused uncharacterized protein